MEYIIPAASAIVAAVAGMRVRENGETYVCTRDIDPLLYPPSQVAAHFNKVKESV